jgi:acetyl-CoA C-acetyltransferase
MADVVIVETARTAMGRRKGSLAATHPTDLLGAVMFAALARANVRPDVVGQVIGGCVNQVGAQAANVTRTAWLAHAGPIEVAASTVDSQCGSSQHALNLAARLIASGAEDVVLACGVENMNIVPIGANAVDGARAGHGKPITRRYWKHHENTSQFEGAERVATKYGVTRTEADLFSLRSHDRARMAIAGGRFVDQIVPIEVQAQERDASSDVSIIFSVDETPRETSIESLGRLEPVARQDGIHTAGSSSQIADGAAAVLLMSRERAEALGCPARAVVVDTCLVGCDPVVMLEGPIPATRRLLDRHGLTIQDIGVVEINEAFASVVLAWAREIGADMEHVNPNGGAIALGHPLGATGCVLVTKVLAELERTDRELGLVTMCCGGGLGTGTLLRRI